jgi:hypothetical protein
MHVTGTRVNRLSPSAPGFTKGDNGREEVRVCTKEGSHAAMAEVELTQDALIVHVEGMDRLFTLRSRLEVPLSHVEGAEADPEEARRRWHGIMERGV